MRVNVIGTCVSAKAVHGLLEAAGYVVTPIGAHYTLYLDELLGVFGYEKIVIVDGIDCELERHIVNEIARLTDADIVLRRATGIQSDREIRILVRPVDAERLAVEKGIVRGFMRTAGRELPDPDPLIIDAPPSPGFLTRFRRWIS